MVSFEIETITMFVSPLFGVLAAFAVNRAYQTYKLHDRVRGILPYIYFEMALNQYLANYCLRDDPERFVRDKKRFDTTHWDLFKTDLGKWSPVDTTSLAKVYYHLKRANWLLSKDPGARDGCVNHSVNIAEQLMKELASSLNICFNSDSKAENEKKKVRKQFEKAAKFDSDLNEALKRSSQS
jgi:hypothetical protein